MCVGRAVVDDDEFPVGERLGEHRLDRLRQEPGVVLRGHDDGDGAGLIIARLIASRCSRARTFEMQKRYLPLGSCGIASTSSTSYRIARAERLVAPAPRSCRRLASPNVVIGHEADAELRQRLLDDLHLGRAGDVQGEVLGQRDAGDEPPGGRDDVVGLAALDVLDQRQPAAARARPLRRHRPRRRSGSGSAAWRGWSGR